MAEAFDGEDASSISDYSSDNDSCESDLDERENLPGDWTQVTLENDHPLRAIEF